MIWLILVAGLFVLLSCTPGLAAGADAEQLAVLPE